MIVVSNASPNINLAVIGKLDLLHQLYGEVCIPQAVRHEIVVSGAGQPGAAEVAGLGGIKVCPVADRTAVVSLGLEIDEGEAEAIVLTTELRADLILLDERLGRVIASRLGLRTVGLLGALVEAKYRGLVSSVKPILDELIAKAGFWITGDLYDRVLRAVGE